MGNVEIKEDGDEVAESIGSTLIQENGPYWRNLLLMKKQMSPNLSR